jgi:branched-chain amino acid transport system ATP-binding protein
LGKRLSGRRGKNGIEENMNSEIGLKINKINTFYGLSHVLFEVSLHVQTGDLVCLLGRNGAGKTTTLRSIIGLTPPRSGSIRFNGEELVGKRPHQIVRLGMGYVPGDRRIFPELTVRENLEVGRRLKDTAVGWTVERAYELFPTLRRRDEQLGSHLSGGEQQMLAIARSLMGNPEMLLLDEPSEGLAPLLVRALEDQIMELRKKGISILLSEQNVKSALRVSNGGYIIEKGHILFHGTVKDLRENEEARRHLMV